MAGSACACTRGVNSAVSCSQSPLSLRTRRFVTGRAFQHLPLASRARTTRRQDGDHALTGSGLPKAYSPDEWVGYSEQKRRNPNRSSKCFTPSRYTLLALDRKEAVKKAPLRGKRVSSKSGHRNKDTETLVAIKLRTAEEPWVATVVPRCPQTPLFIHFLTPAWSPLG
ncbi:hypothetical protein J6590_016437 [Homalodisca vitripennis]|nr:hypothetical protein J6590_016437 [Homalodisca vitripennis]